MYDKSKNFNEYNHRTLNYIRSTSKLSLKDITKFSKINYNTYIKVYPIKNMLHILVQQKRIFCNLTHFHHNSLEN